MPETQHNSAAATTVQPPPHGRDRITIRALYGPSLYADRPVVVLTWDEIHEVSNPWPHLFATVTDLAIGNDPPDLAVAAQADGTASRRHLVACLAQWLDRRAGPTPHPALFVTTTRSGIHSAVAASFIDEVRTAEILSAAWGLADIVLSRCLAPAPAQPPTPAVTAAIRQLRETGTIGAEAGTEFAMFFALARHKGIPALVVPHTKKFLLLGEGASGRLVQSTSNDRDSAVGTALAIDKFMSNAVVQRLGLPAVWHVMVPPAAAGALEAVAAQAARAVGFPLVVKPVSNGKGNGVFTGITSVGECAAAIREALRYCPRGALVERQIAGDDHRLAVAGGRLAWAVARRPAAVTGDGASTVRQLIDRENARRRSLTGADRPFQSSINVDAELTAHLAKQGLSLDSVPRAGEAVAVRGISNVSKGGTYEDVSDRVHPDNRAMAETIAAVFRMDTMGIDYMTTDITRSWREVGGGIVEVNQTPAAGTTVYVTAILAHMFPERTNVRVPYVIFVNDHAGTATTAWMARARAQGYRIGSFSATATALDDEPRGKPHDGLNERLVSLILDPRVGLLVARLTSDDIAREGLLREIVDKVFLGPDVAPEVERLLRSRCQEVLPLPS